MRKVSVFLVSAILVLGLVGCSSDEDTKETTAEPTKVETTAIVVTKEETTTVEQTTVAPTTAEPTTVAPTEAPTVAPTTTVAATQKPAKKKPTKKATKSTAKKYVGKTLDELVAAVGKYNSLEKAKSCLYDGEYDGIAQYDNFIVGCHTEDGQWIIDYVE